MLTTTASIAMARRTTALTREGSVLIQSLPLGSGQLISSPSARAVPLERYTRPEAAQVSIPTLKRAEAGGPIKVADDTIAAIAKALEKAGVEFIAENGGGAGVRRKKKTGKR
jgi:hypothetical protein